MLHEAHIKNLELVQVYCTCIRTLELLLSPGRTGSALNGLSTAKDRLHFLDTTFENIPSVPEVFTHFEV